MKLTGEATLRAGVNEVYAALVDPAVLVRTIPGCQRLEQVGEDDYKATILAGVASIKGVFDGQVRVADRRPGESFTLHASGAGAPGTVSAVARVAIAPADGGGTLLRYDADATIGGVIAGVGQRMIMGVAKKTAAEFFANVDRELSLVAVGAGPASAAVTPEPAAAAPLGGTAAQAGAAAAPAGAVAAPAGTAAGAPGAATAAPAAASPGAAATPGVWTAPARPVDPARQRIRDLALGAAFGALIALLGVLVGALVAGW